jgi:hypothetical protein
MPSLNAAVKRPVHHEREHMKHIVKDTSAGSRQVTHLEEPNQCEMGHPNQITEALRMVAVNFRPSRNGKKGHHNQLTKALRTVAVNFRSSRNGNFSL